MDASKSTSIWWIIFILSAFFWASCRSSLLQQYSSLSRKSFLSNASCRSASSPTKACQIRLISSPSSFTASTFPEMISCMKAFLLAELSFRIALICFFTLAFRFSSYLLWHYRHPQTIGAFFSTNVSWIISSRFPIFCDIITMGWDSWRQVFIFFKKGYAFLCYPASSG